MTPTPQQHCDLTRELLSILRTPALEMHQVNLLRAVIQRREQAVRDEYEIPELGAGDILPGPEFSFPDVRLCDDGIRGGESGTE